MTMTLAAEGFDADIVSVIMDRLDRVEAEHRVRITWAIESGSRAWGFPSPDSDYDCRFFYLRSPADYLSPWRPRDVIETPLDAVYDVNGWDLIKAVDLAVRGNATVVEWLRSPYLYRGDPQFADALLELCAEVSDHGSLVRHYSHLLAHAWGRVQPDEADNVALKKVLYALRPAAVLRWLRINHSATPPMDLPTLLDEAPPPPEAVEPIAELVHAKARTRELGLGKIAPAVSDLIISELGASDPTPESPEETATKRRRASKRFIDLVERFAPET